MKVISRAVQKTISLRSRVERGVLARLHLRDFLSDRFPVLSKHFAFSLVLSFACCFLSTTTGAEEAGSKEYKIKIAFIYNFAKFVTWPKGAFPDTAAPVSICLADFENFAAALPSYNNKKVGKRSLKFHDINQLASLESCSIVYLSQAKTQHWAKEINRRGLISVGEGEHFFERGGVINFYTEKNKLRFAINLNTAKKVGVTFNSRLLRLAKVVGRD